MKEVPGLVAPKPTKTVRPALHPCHLISFFGSQRLIFYKWGLSHQCYFYVSKFFNQLLNYKLTVDQIHDDILLSNKLSPQSVKLNLIVISSLIWFCSIYKQCNTENNFGIYRQLIVFVLSCVFGYFFNS